MQAAVCRAVAAGEPVQQMGRNVMRATARRDHLKPLDCFFAHSGRPRIAKKRGVLPPIREAAPDADEKISYKIPAFTLNGDLVYFAAFKNHIGLYPPVKEDEKLQKEISAYKGEKGNLKFPLNRPIPYALIGKIVRFRVKEHLQKAQAKRKKQ